MSYKPLISKIRCHNPNLKSARYANRANLHYIATREGVEHSEISDEKQDTQMYNHATDEEYTRYIAKRPRSHGLFGNIDTEDLKSVEQLVYNTSKQGKNIYRGIISLSSEDAQELGYVNSKIWYQQLNSIMPDIAKELGISSTNFTWIGSFHAEPSHPHVHYQLWDNTDKVKSSFLHVSVQKRCRALIEKSIFTEEYEKTLQTVFESERDELYSLKNESRDIITDYFKDVMNIAHVPGIQHTDLPSKLPTRDAQKIAEHLDALQDILPTSGRMNYKFMSPEIKKELDKISDIFFKQPDMKEALSQYLQAANHIHQISVPGYSKKSQDNAKKEIYRRTGNIILKNMNQYLNNISYAEKNYEDNLHNNQINSTLDNIVLNDIPLDDVKSAIDYFEKAVELNNTYAKLALAKIQLSNEYGEFQNVDNALKLLNELTETNNPDAQYTLGKIYLSEDFPDYQNIPKAIELLTASAEQGNQFAQLKLGTIYLYGKYSVPQNEELGKKYLNESADQGNAYAKDTLQNYEFFHSPMYVMTNLIYKSLYAAMMTDNRKKQQQLQEIKWELSKQARIEKRKQNEITHL